MVLNSEIGDLWILLITLKKKNEKHFLFNIEIKFYI